MRRALLPLLTLAALLGACADDADSGAASMTPPAATAAPPPTAEADAAPRRARARAAAVAAPRGTTIRLAGSQFGRIVADGRGQAAYFFDKETSARPQCYGACAEAWPPVLTSGRPVAAGGARASLLGVTRRRGGRRQVTYAGRPLYYYVADAPGLVLCHDVEEFGGLWVVIRADGTRVP